MCQCVSGPVECARQFCLKGPSSKELTASDLVSIIVAKFFGKLVIFEASEPEGKRIIRPASAPARFKV